MEDARIVELYWERDERAIPETADKYGNFCWKIARNILENEEDADECVNDTYLGAWNDMPPSRPMFLRAYLGKLVRNLSINRWRREHALKRGGGNLTLVFEELSEIVSDKEQGKAKQLDEDGKSPVEQEVAAKELAKELDAFLESLPRQKRQIFVRRYWYADSTSEIAKDYGMKVSAVSMSLSRLREQLRAYLLERGYQP